jgi:hypothetical protein
MVLSRQELEHYTGTFKDTSIADEYTYVHTPPPSFLGKKLALTKIPQQLPIGKITELLKKYWLPIAAIGIVSGYLLHKRRK